MTTTIDDIDHLLTGAIDLDCRTGPSLEPRHFTHDYAA